MVATASRLTPDALEVDDRERGAARRARDHDGEVGDVAVGHRELLAGDLAALELGLLVLRGRDLGALGQRERADQLAGGELGQILLLLLFAAGGEDRLGREIDRGRERHRRHRAAELLGDAAQLEVAVADPAVLLGDRDPGPLEVDDPLPQLGGVGLVTVQDAARHRGRARALEEVARLGLEHLLGVGEIEVHAVSWERNGRLEAGHGERRRAARLEPQSPAKSVTEGIEMG